MLLSRLFSPTRHLPPEFDPRPQGRSGAGGSPAACLGISGAGGKRQRGCGGWHNFGRRRGIRRRTQGGAPTTGRSPEGREGPTGLRKHLLVINFLDRWSGICLISSLTRLRKGSHERSAGRLLFLLLFWAPDLRLDLAGSLIKFTQRPKKAVAQPKRPRLFYWRPWPGTR